MPANAILNRAKIHLPHLQYDKHTTIASKLNQSVDVHAYDSPDHRQAYLARHIQTRRNMLQWVNA